MRFFYLWSVLRVVPHLLPPPPRLVIDPIYLSILVAVVVSPESLVLAVFINLKQNH